MWRKELWNNTLGVGLLLINAYCTHMLYVNEQYSSILRFKISFDLLRNALKIPEIVAF